MRFNKTLFTIHLLEFVMFFGFGVVFFSSPQLKKLLESFGSRLDLFYRAIFQKGLEALINNYITAGSITLGLGFGALICLLIIHSRAKRLLWVNTLYSIILLPIIPIGTIFAFLTLPTLWYYGSSEEDEPILIRKQHKEEEASKKSIGSKIRLPKFLHRIKLNRKRPGVSTLKN